MRDDSDVAIKVLQSLEGIKSSGMFFVFFLS